MQDVFRGKRDFAWKVAYSLAQFPQLCRAKEQREFDGGEKQDCLLLGQEQALVPAQGLGLELELEAGWKPG